MPKLAPAPLRPQKRSGFDVAETVTKRPSAVTSFADRSESTIMPRAPCRRPTPPPREGETSPTHADAPVSVRTVNNGNCTSTRDHVQSLSLTGFFPGCVERVIYVEEANTTSDSHCASSCIHIDTPELGQVDGQPVSDLRQGGVKPVLGRCPQERDPAQAGVSDLQE